MGSQYLKCLIFVLIYTTVILVFNEHSSHLGFPRRSVGKESACIAGDLSSIPGSGISPGGGNGSPLQYSFLENSMDRGARQTTVHGVARVRHDLGTKPPPPPFHTYVRGIALNTEHVLPDGNLTTIRQN